MRDIAGIPGAHPAALPALVKPMLASLYKAPPAGEEWLHEIKYDGYRIVARLQGGKARLFTRNDNELTHRFPKVAAAVEALPAREAWIDGEIVVLRRDGRSSFGDLQKVLLEGRSTQVRYMVFDLMHLDGFDLRGVELARRKELLRELVPGAGVVRYVEHLRGSGDIVYREACSMELEGIVSKEATSHYLSERSNSWRKVKCRRQEEFLVGGYTGSTGGKLFGSLLVGRMENGKLRFTGKVGSGFSSEKQARVLEALRRHEQNQSPFDNPPAGPEYLDPRWLRPRLAARVEYAEITDEGLLRHASFKGLRELPEEPSPGERLKSVRRPDVEAHYRLVAELMLPHIVDRPLWLLRCPWGIHSPCSPKRHANGVPPPARPIAVPGHDEPYFTIDAVDGLMALMEMGTLEIHSWQCRHRRVEFPDRLVFDLDPGEGVTAEELRRGALLVRELLGGLGLESFVKTSGRRGFHLHVPLEPGEAWEEVSRFARTFSLHCARRHPSLFVSRSGPENRRGRIFVDWMRNTRGNNSVDAWSLRAGEGAPAAVPLEWRELEQGVAPDAFHLGNIRQRLEKLPRDPWEEYFRIRQSVPPR
ncbi:MAG TPA: non-homologous end-joining DNA ligase [Verrucomicrobiae bacterium]|nr:non-homologous end-joining DNA ligase [Verrucomicrobiae bacterium]